MLSAAFQTRLCSLPLAVGTTLALLVLDAAPASAQGPGGAAAGVTDAEGQVQPVVAAPGATPQPVVGGIAPGAPVGAANGDSAKLIGAQALSPSVAPPQVLAAVAAANSIAGLRFDTSGRGGKGPRWRKESRPSRGFVARHPAGL